MLIVVPVLAFFALLGLKLAGTVDWSWWIVTVPLWISLVGFTVTVAFLGAWALLVKWVDKNF